MNDPIDLLMQEHRAIEKVLDALDKAASLDVPIAFYERAVEFITRFADGRHHDKEEGLLFPALEANGLPRGGGPIGVMLEEHEVGRACVARMREAIADHDLDLLRSAARDYTDLLRPHIAKEDGILYAMARRVLPPQEMEALASRFEAVEAEHREASDPGELATSLLAEVS